MISTHTGEIAALSVSVLWTGTAVIFEYAAKRVGTVSLNLIRLVIAFFFLVAASLLLRGTAVPLDASREIWFWMTLSGLIGFVIGDIFLFKAYMEIGARVTNALFASVPPITAVLGWVLLGETMSPKGIAGMAITLIGVGFVVTKKSDSGGSFEFAHPVRGVVCAFLGALGQAGGLVLSKYGAPTYHPVSATQIRCLAGIIGFTAVALFLRRGKRIVSALKDRKAMGPIVLGAFLGPFLGVSLGLFAIQHTSAGIASTLMSLVPIFIILPSHILFHEKVTVREIFGAAVAVAGTAVLFLR